MQLSPPAFMDLYTLNVAAWLILKKQEATECICSLLFTLLIMPTLWKTRVCSHKIRGVRVCLCTHTHCTRFYLHVNAHCDIQGRYTKLFLWMLDTLPQLPSGKTTTFLWNAPCCIQHTMVNCGSLEKNKEVDTDSVGRIQALCEHWTTLLVSKLLQSLLDVAICIEQQQSTKHLGRQRWMFKELCFTKLLPCCFSKLLFGIHFVQFFDSCVHPMDCPEW